MVVNRVGDLGLVLAIGSIFLAFKSLDFAIIFALTPLVAEDFFSFLSVQFNCLTVISLLLFVGSVGKSAQLGLHI